MKSRTAYVASGVGIAALSAFVAWGFASSREQPGQTTTPTIRVGYFPNLTHAQALVALNFRRHGQDWFSARLHGQANVEWRAFNAGPSAMMSLVARSIDMGYAGPSSILNAYALSNGSQIRVVAGAVTGGSALVVQPGFDSIAVAKFRGKRIATPEFGNTQDIAARAWLFAGGLVVGKDVQVVPIPNPDQINLFRLVAIDGAWTIEPWVSRLELLADAKVVVEEKDALTTLLAANTQFLAKHAQLADAFIAAHRDLTEWIIQHPTDAQRMLTEELQIRFKADMPDIVLRKAWPRIHLTSEVSPAAFAGFLAKAKDAGFVSNVDMRWLVETGCVAGACANAAAPPQTN